MGFCLTKYPTEVLSAMFAQSQWSVTIMGTEDTRDDLSLPRAVTLNQDHWHGWPSTQPGSLHTALQRKYTQPCSLFSRCASARLCRGSPARVTLYTAGHLHTAVPHCSHSRAPIVHTAVPRENNEHGCVYLRCRAVCKLPGCVEGHPWLDHCRYFCYLHRFWPVVSNLIASILIKIFHCIASKTCFTGNAMEDFEYNLSN